MRVNRVGVCAAALLLAAAGPERAPGRFTSRDFGVTAAIPPGLSHCPTPAGYAGGNHGVTVYLTPPRACDPGAPEAVAEEAARLPQIRLYFTYYVVETPGRAPPRTNAALHRQSCPETLSDWPGRMTMLDVPAATCFEHRGEMITLAVGTLYRQERIGAFDGVPDSAAWLVLQTTPGRYSYDLRVFQAVLQGVRQCRPAGAAAFSGRPGCPGLDAGW